MKQTISNYCTHKTGKKVYPIVTLFKNLSILICITSYLWHILLGRCIRFQATKIIQNLIQKRCIRILFGESYSFDHPEYYATCCRTKTYQEHVALKDYALDHTKPLFNKHSLLTFHNLYASRSLVELIKILKLHSPYPVYESLQFCPQTHHFRLPSPKYNLDISKNNYFVSSINLWNKCISKLLDNPDLLSSLRRSYLIIPGYNVNSDMTIPIGTFKKGSLKLTF